MTFAPPDLYHSGYLVEDLEASRDRLVRLGHRTWTPPKDHELRIRAGGEERTIRFRYVYSAEGPHHLELIQPVDGGYLEADGPMGFHHLGYWVDDLEAGIAAAPEHGLSLECLFLDDGGAAKVAYLLDEAGVRHEMVPRSHQPIMEERWARARTT